ncbi:hypothetical protein AAFC00_004774 [Neodothiora populina]|uniref:Sucrase/ferredoxin-like family protein n=1 Tax=Neodothiora populina TaxID=2781224 RepID=A0ABR3P4H5_9PEZI
MASLLRGLSSRFLTPQPTGQGFQKASDAAQLFPKTDPAVDGEDCLHDCQTCTITYPRKFNIDEDDKLYGHVTGWNTHMVVATGKTDWVRDVQDEKDSVMQAVGKSKVQPTNGKMMLSASNMPVPDHSSTETTVLLLPAFKYIDNVTPASVPDLIQSCIDQGPTNTSPLKRVSQAPSDATNGDTDPHQEAEPVATTTIPTTLPAGLTMRNCPHKYLVLLCSHATRDARCGQSAPLLRREFERHLRPMGLYRDLDDERPGGVGIYFINHVGGHKYSANAMIYRRGATGQAGEEETEQEAAQCIWMARIKPADVENLVRYTLLQGKMVDPQRQLRGGFDRVRQLTSW